MSGRTKMLSMLWALLVNCSIASQPSPASSFDDGIRLYQSRQYSAALNRFANASRCAPSNATIHYYMGLCYQSTNQMSLAKQQYEWVSAYAGNDRSLQNKARTALSQLSKYQPTWSSGNSPTQTEAAGNGTKNPESTTKPRIAGRLKVIEFYSDT